MIHAGLNIAVGIALLLFTGWEWRRHKLNLWIFALALFHSLLGVLMFTNGSYFGEGIDYYIVIQKNHKMNHIFTYIEENIKFSYTFIYLEITAAAIGLILLFAVPKEACRYRMGIAIAIQAIVASSIFIFQSKFRN